jgi:hypothetical protein
MILEQKRKIDFEERDKFIVANMQTRLQEKGYDIFWFEGLSYKDLLTCIKKGWADPEETQNSSPSIQELADFLEDNPAFKAHGYVVSPGREDRRISLEGVKACRRPSPRSVQAFFGMFRQADECDIVMPYRAWYD